jgi:hypothetical protein
MHSSEPFRVQSILLILCCSITRCLAVEVPNFETEAIVAEKQDAPEWCWAASVQAICKHVGLGLSQSEIVQSTYGIPMDVALHAPTDLAQGLARIAATRGLQFFGSPYYQSVDNQRVQWELRVGYPVLTFIRNDAYSGHAIVVYAMTKDDTGDDYTVKYWDPWPTAQQVNRTKLSILASRLHGYCFFRIRRNGQILKAPQTSSEDVFDESNEEVSKIHYEDVGKYVTMSQQAFSSIRGAQNDDSEDPPLPGITEYKCTIKPLGGADVSITKDERLSSNGKADWELRANFYYGPRELMAKQVYNKLIAVMIGSLPEWTATESTKDDQHNHFSTTKTVFSKSGRTSVSVQLSRHQSRRDLQNGTATYIVSWHVDCRP